MAEMLELWLSFGQKTEHPGALRVDIRPVADQIEDIRALSFGDNCFDGVECLHVLEHLLPDEAKQATNEIWRVLKPGGVAIVGVPDLERCARELLDGDLRILWNIYSPSNESAQRHRWGYIPRTLRELLEQAGFQQINEIDRIDPNEIRLMARKS